MHKIRRLLEDWRNASRWGWRFHRWLIVIAYPTLVPWHDDRASLPKRKHTRDSSQ